LEADDEEFIALIRDHMREEGRERLVRVLLNDGEAADVMQLQYEGLMSGSGDPGNNIDDGGGDSSDSTDSSDDDVSDSDSDDNQSIGDEVEGVINPFQLHEMVIHDHVHCPPFDDISSTFSGAYSICDCENYGLAYCSQENNFSFYLNSFYKIDFEEQHILAKASIDNKSRKPNNSLRKYFYKKIFIALDFGVLERGERRRLPNCAVARVRQIYPSETGLYMGFKEN
jgi:hypothetical protein